MRVPGQVAFARSGRFGSGQYVAVELAVMVAAGAIYSLPVLPAAAVTAGAVILVLPVIGRYGGRFWYEIAGAWLALRARREHGARAARRVQADGPYRSELAALAPGLSVRTVSDHQMRIGLGADDDGWFGVIALAPHDALSRAEGSQLRMDWLTRAAGPQASVQLVIRHTSLPAPGGSDTPCGQSYGALREALAAPAQRDVWIAVRVGGPWTATPLADGAGVARAVGGALSRVSAALTAHGLEHTVLDGPGVDQALLAAYGPDPYDGRLARQPRTPRELWTRWRAAHLVHISYAVANWTARPGLLAGLVRVPAAVSATTAVIVNTIRERGQESGPTGARMVVRLATKPEHAGQAARELRAAARSLGVRLVRLDGEQAAAVYATTPTAAVDGWGATW
jgi:type VII secretion protein EccE